LATGCFGGEGHLVTDMPVGRRCQPPEIQETPVPQALLTLFEAADVSPFQLQQRVRTIFSGPLRASFLSAQPN
jgi:hypothetical protein